MALSPKIAALLDRQCDGTDSELARALDLARLLADRLSGYLPDPDDADEDAGLAFGWMYDDACELAGIIADLIDDREAELYAP
jgi:hypothetical protein